MNRSPRFFVRVRLSLMLRFFVTFLVLAFAVFGRVQPSLESVRASTAETGGPAAQIHSLKILVLSTMLVGEPSALGEWGFSALVEADGHRILLDTGAHPDTVATNARNLKIDLSGIHEVILTHNHSDLVAGLLALRREWVKKDPAAMSIVHAGVVNILTDAGGMA